MREYERGLVLKQFTVLLRRYELYWEIRRQGSGEVRLGQAKGVGVGELQAGQAIAGQGRGRGGGRLRHLSQGWGRAELRGGQEARGYEAGSSAGEGAEREVGPSDSQPHSPHFLEPTYKYSLLQAP